MMSPFGQASFGTPTKIDSALPDSTQQCFTVTAWPVEITDETNGDKKSWYVSMPADHVYCAPKVQLLDKTSFSYNSEATNYKNCVSMYGTDGVKKSVCAQSQMDLSNMGLNAALMEMLQPDS